LNRKFCRRFQKLFYIFLTLFFLLGNGLIDFYSVLHHTVDDLQIPQIGGYAKMISSLCQKSHLLSNLHDFLVSVNAAGVTRKHK
jgi:hypothetical protein